MHPILFKIGPLTIYTYGFFVFLGVVFGYIVARKSALKNGISDPAFADIFFWGIVSSFLGARLLYILVEIKNLSADPWGIIFGRAGFVFYGGVLAGFAAVYFLTKKFKVDFMKLCDSSAPGLALGHALGRVGCFFYGCCYGRPDDRCGLLFPPESPAGMLGVKVLPIQLIESFCLFVLFLILWSISRRKKFDGQVFALYLILYPVLRFSLEFFRYDPRGSLYGFSTSQIISIFVFIAGIILFYKRRVRV
jgi:phosphatidylglycerol---prolipoprotein diacylglyceryl transferase